MARRRKLGRRFFTGDVVRLARDLLGLVLLKDGVGGPIVEAEAYRQDEAACHARQGRTQRNQSMFLSGGHLYVYRIHQSICVNVVAGREGEGNAVLVRALSPTDGREVIAERRSQRPERIWTDGPGKLCQALKISLEDDGQDLLGDGPVRLVDRGLRYSDSRVEVGPRVGISKARELSWRFLLRPAP